VSEKTIRTKVRKRHRLTRFKRLFFALKFPHFSNSISVAEKVRNAVEKDDKTVSLWPYHLPVVSLIFAG
jgi:hypothetical protein